MLTPSEMGEHVRALMEKIKRNRVQAEHMLSQVGGGSAGGWRPDHPDYWRLVKLPHGLPKAFQRFAIVSEALGRCPLTWSEFAQHYGAASPAEIRALANAEATGGAVREQRTVG